MGAAPTRRAAATASAVEQGEDLRAAGDPGRFGRRPSSAAVSRLARAIVTATCIVLLGAQLIWLLQWSWHLLDDAHMTWDYAIYYQAWYQVAHGHLLARNTLQGGYLFLRNDGELIVYLLAPLYWLFPNHQLGYLWLQDLAIVGASATCLRLVIESLPWRTTAPWRDQLAAGASRLLIVVLVLANPFVYWAASYDIHMEVFGTFFALLLLRAALQQRRSAAIFAVLTAMCGAAAVLYVIGVGLALAAIAVWRCRATPRRFLPAVARPAALCAFGLAWLAVLGALHAQVGSPGWQYAYLAGFPVFATPSVAEVGVGILEHLHTAYVVVASHGWNLWANTSPSGFVGLFSPALLVVALPLLANNLVQGQAFSEPSFQNFIVYGVVALGSVCWVVVLLRRRVLVVVGVALASVMVWNALGWFNAWSPSISIWYSISPGVAALVKKTAHEIPAGDEVVASQSFVGMFAGRAEVYPFITSIVFPVRSHTVWFVLSTAPGTDSASGTETDSALGTIEQLPGIEAVALDDDGIDIWRWHPPAGSGPVSLGTLGSHYPLWLAPGPDVVPITSGAPSRWSVRTDGRTVYLVVGDFFQLAPGRYVATMRLQSRSPVTAEVWNDSGGESIITGKVVRPVRARDVRLHFVVPGNAASYEYAGSGPTSGNGLFRYLPVTGSPMPPTIEVRVWVAPATVARAWWVSITPTAHG